MAQLRFSNRPSAPKDPAGDETGDAATDADNSFLFADPAPPANSRRRTMRRVSAIVAGVVVFAGVVTLALNKGELGDFAEQASRAEPGWIGLGVAGQIAAFLSQALVWRLVLARLGCKISLFPLFRLSLAKLCADQTLPSAGISGAVFIVHALTKHGATQKNAMAAFIFGAASFIAAFAIAVLASFTYIALEHAPARIAAVGVVAGATVVAAALVALAITATIRTGRIRKRLMRNKLASRAIALVSYAVATIGSEKRLFARSVLIQIGQRLCDALTLWLAFFAIGEHAPFAACLAGISVASIAATIAPTPMGIGSFEGALVATLTGLGAPVEAALTTTLLYRGLSLWLPLGLGFIVIQHELLRRGSPPPASAAT